MSVYDCFTHTQNICIITLYSMARIPLILFNLHILKYFIYGKIVYVEGKALTY